MRGDNEMAVLLALITWRVVWMDVYHAELAERLIALVLKTSYGKPYGDSNSSLCVKPY